MKEERILKDRLNLLEKELAILTDQVEHMKTQLKESADLKNEIKGLKLFLGRLHPEFKNKFPEIMQKIYKKKQKRFNKFYCLTLSRSPLYFRLGESAWVRKGGLRGITYFH